MSATTLSPFEGRQVVGATISVRNAGDGLSAAMEVEAREFHIGERVLVLLETECAAVDHLPIDKDHPELLTRRHVLRAGTATVLEGANVELVQALLEDQAAAIAKHREAEELRKEHEAGVQRLPGTVTTTQSDPVPPAPQCQQPGCPCVLEPDDDGDGLLCPTHGTKWEYEPVDDSTLAADRAVTDIRKARADRRTRSAAAPDPAPVDGVEQ